MIPAARDWLVRHGLVGRFFALALIIGAALLAAWLVADAQFGELAASAAIAAGATVFVISCFATTLAELAKQLMQSPLAVLLAMLVRMGFALGVCVLVQFTGGNLAAGGFIYFVLVFYLVALPIETTLELLAINEAPSLANKR